jgi:hypothetical protein
MAKHTLIIDHDVLEASKHGIVELLRLEAGDRVVVTGAVEVKRGLKLELEVPPGSGEARVDLISGRVHTFGG